MVTQLGKLWSDEAGVILSAELVIILTIAVLGMVVGLSCLQSAIIAEFNDLAMAFRSLNQSYSTPWFRGCLKYWGGGRTSWVAGSSFYNCVDGCGCNGYGYGGDICGQGAYLPPTSGVMTLQPPATVGGDACSQGQLTQPTPNHVPPTPAAPSQPVEPANP